MVDFRWNRWNVEHIAEHGVQPEEAQQVVRAAKRSYPRYRGDGKYLVWGQTRHGAYLQVVYILEPDDVIYVIHARPLTAREKQQYRRGQP